MNNIKLDAILVTFNRLDKLKKALASYDSQTASFRNLIVVDNYSTDGTREFLKEWELQPNEKYNKIVIYSDDNLGGAGGFALGEKKVLELKPDWVVAADDDAYADKDLVKNFYEYINSHDTSKLAVITTEVLNMDGSVCVAHRMRHTKIHNKGIGYTVIEDCHDCPEFPVSLFSYVGPIFKIDTLKRYGTINADYFIYNDDTEHSLRILLGGGSTICVTSLKFTHEGNHGTTEASDMIVCWNNYYEIRNAARLQITHFPKCKPDYFMIMIRKYIKHLITQNPRELIHAVAVKDALIGNMGKHYKYKPGWKITK